MAELQIAARFTEPKSDTTRSQPERPQPVRSRPERVSLARMMRNDWKGSPRATQKGDRFNAIHASDKAREKVENWTAPSRAAKSHRKTRGRGRASRRTG